MSNDLIIHILIPVYNEANSLEKNIKRVISALDKDDIAFNITIIDDGSTDATLDIVKILGKEDRRIFCYTLNKNIGKDIAIMSCLCSVNAACFLVLDSDMQLPLHYIKKMVDIIKDDPNIDIISAERESRNTGTALYRLMTTLFYTLLLILTGKDMRFSTDYKLFNSKCAKLIRDQFNSGQLYFRGVCERLPVKHIKTKVFLSNSTRKTRFSIIKYFVHAKNVFLSIYRQRRMFK